VIAAPLDHRLLARVVAAWLDQHLRPLLSVLVEPGQHVKAVLPAPKDGQVAGGVVVRDARGRALAVAPGLELDVSVVARGLGVDLDARVRG
jgi:hypothetical protein